MSIEEAIEWLERYIREGHRMIDEHSLLTDEHGYKEFEDGIKAREAILVLLKTHPEAQPNELLTLEELSEMDGQPVWIDLAGGFWALVDAINHRLWICRVGWTDMRDSVGRIYRRPPKEET